MMIVIFNIKYIEKYIWIFNIKYIEKYIWTFTIKYIEKWSNKIDKCEMSSENHKIYRKHLKLKYFISKHPTLSLSGHDWVRTQKVFGNWNLSLSPGFLEVY